MGWDPNVGGPAALSALAALIFCAGAPRTAEARPADEVTAALQRVLTDRDQPGPIPGVRRLEVTETTAVIGLELPADVDLSDLPPEIENRYETAVGALAALRPGVDAIHLLVAHPGKDLAPPPKARLPRAGPPAPRQTIRPDPMRFPHGQALVGHTIAISPGHGYIYYDSLGRYSTQRSNIKWQGCGSCDGIIEDFGSQQLAVRYLIPLLEGAGARVVLVRERDYNAVGSIVDDGDSGFQEVAGAFTAGSSEGGHGADYKVSGDPDAQVQWTLTAPRAGAQMLSLWFVSGANRHGDAWVEVNGGAGSTRFLLDMTSHGRRWVPVSLLDLPQGQPVTVSLSAPTNPAADRFLIADAVRLGAGTHDSGHAWWSMGAQPYAAYQGAPASVRTYGDVSIRPAYAEWYGADAYVALHSNASGQPESTAAGTASYRYNCGSFPDHSNDPPASSCDDPVGSDRLQALVHEEMVGQIKADWDSNWADRGTKVANFGEVRNLDRIPGVLMESAFHDNVRLPGGSALRMTDNQAMHDPRWRRAAGYGLYKGLSRFFAPDAPFLALPPDRLVARRVGPGTLEVSFGSVADARGYRIYAAANGGAFDAGRLVEGSPALLEDLPEDAVVVIKVATVNDAGEGAAGRMVAARTSLRPAQALIIDAFEREDAWVQEWDNPGDTARVHALALLETEYAFDGAHESALEAGLIDLSEYEALIVALGRESTGHDILTPALRTQIASLAASGTSVFFGGTEIGWALDARGDDAGRAFLDDVFGAVYVADDAEADAIVGAAGGWLEGARADLADGTRGLVETQFPDALRLGTDGVAELSYTNGGDLAGVRRGKNLLLGVALDNLVGADVRAAVLGGWLSQAVTLAPPDVIPPPMDGGVPAPDAGPAPPGDAGVADAAPIDASPVDGGIALRPTHPEPIRGGCTCSGTGALPVANLLWMVFLGLILPRSRRR